MVRFLTPGVYRLPERGPRLAVQPVRTDVAGFVGYAERGPLADPAVPEPVPTDLAVRLSSWADYGAVFGGYTATGALPYAVRAFFDNGGRNAYVVRIGATHHADPLERPRAAAFAVPSPAAPVDVAHLTADAAEGDVDLVVDAPATVAEGDLVTIASGGVEEWRLVVGHPVGGLRLSAPLEAGHPSGTPLRRLEPALRLTARSRGNWGNRLRVVLTPLTTGFPVQDFALRVRLEPGLDASRPKEEEFYKRLSLDPARADFAPLLVNGASRLVELEVPATAGLDLGALLWGGPVALQGGRDGLRGATVEDFVGTVTGFRGLRLLEEIDEVAILAAPDAVFEPLPVTAPPPPPVDPCAPPPAIETGAPAPDPTAVPPALDPLAVYRPMIEQCERLRDRVAVVDPPDRLGPVQVAAWREALHTRFAALYYPWLKVPEAVRGLGPTRRVPPSGHVAGVYARIDNAFGVHRPPANAPLEFVTDVVEEISALAQENLNPAHVNVLRSFPGRGIRPWGARSLSYEGEWRFIHTRRLLSMIEEAVEDSTQWTVFEPHDDALRRTLTHSLSVFLESIWRAGGLKGSIPAEGFFVRCDETNNPPASVDLGRLVCQVGVAIAAPMEFLVFEIHRTTGGSELVEA